MHLHCLLVVNQDERHCMQVYRSACIDLISYSTTYLIKIIISIYSNAYYTMVLRFLKYCKFKYDPEHKSTKYTETYCLVSMNIYIHINYYISYPIGIQCISFIHKINKTRVFHLYLLV